MNKAKLILGMLVFGSIWGLLECTLGDYLHETNLPAGTIMTVVVGLGLMILSRSIYRQRGMQLGMGLIAGGLRYVNPVGGYLLCSVFAIAAEAVVFELIWSLLDINELSLSEKIGMGIITGYGCYTLGYIFTQVATPLFSSVPFYLSDLISILPSILAKGLIAAGLGVIVLPLATSLKTIDIYKIKDRFYYPTTFVVIGVCWLVGTIII